MICKLRKGEFSKRKKNMESLARSAAEENGLKGKGGMDVVGTRVSICKFITCTLEIPFCHTRVFSAVVESLLDLYVCCGWETRVSFTPKK